MKTSMKTSLTTLALVATLAVSPISSAESGKGSKTQGQRFFVGTVVDVKDINLKGMSVKHTLFKVENKTGKTMVVNVGAGAEVGDIKKGDKVAFVGKTARINGKPVLFAKAFGEMANVGRTGKEK
jgi:Cu/Ag efflux protein CusF